MTVQRKQYPGILGHAITVHKSQGSTLAYMKGDLDRKSQKITKLGKEYLAPVCQGQLYTLLSREPEQIKVNLSALEEMNRMRTEALFDWKHPLRDMNETKLCPFNIRSWNLHIEHFISDDIVTECDIMCFTETHCNGETSKSIGKYLDG